MNRPLQLAFLGDIALNDDYVAATDRDENVNAFEAILPLLSGSDLVLANWEMAMRATRINERKIPRVITTPAAARYALPLKLGVVSLANNHMYDCREEGFAATLAFLDGHQIQHVGAGWTQAEARQPILLERSGYRIGILAYVSHSTHPNIPEDAGVHLNWFEIGRTRREIADLKQKADLVVAIVHWEYHRDFFPLPNPQQRRDGQALIEAGASIVLGGHPHCLQGFEWYQGGLIHYSLGNTIFSDIRPPNGDHSFSPASRRSGLAKITHDGQTLSQTLTAVQQLGLSVCPTTTPIAVRCRIQLLRLPRGLYTLLWRLLWSLLLVPCLLLQRDEPLLKSVTRIRPRHLLVLMKRFRNANGD